MQPIKSFEEESNLGEEASCLDFSYMALKGNTNWIDVECVVTCIIDDKKGKQTRSVVKNAYLLLLILESRPTLCTITIYLLTHLTMNLKLGSTKQHQVYQVICGTSETTKCCI